MDQTWDILESMQYMMVNGKIVFIYFEEYPIHNIVIDFDIMFFVGKQWKQWINGKLLPLSFKYFPSFNSSSGNFGDSLMVHPMDTTQLFITPYYKDVMVGGNFKLFPLCYKDKTLTCKNHNYDCCDNGDCIYGKCSCYPGWSPETNCCAPSSCNATISTIDEFSNKILPTYEISNSLFDFRS